LADNDLKYWVKVFQKCEKDEGFSIDGASLLAFDNRLLDSDFPDTKSIPRRQLLAKLDILKAGGDFSAPQQGSVVGFSTPLKPQLPEPSSPPPTLEGKVQSSSVPPKLLRQPSAIHKVKYLYCMYVLWKKQLTIYAFWSELEKKK